MRKILSTLCIALAVLWVSVDVHAQSTMEVVKFTRMKNDLTARITHPVRDTDEGRLCALIRVVTNLKDIEFRADALGIVKQEQRKGEVWLYVPYGAKSIAFRHEGYFPVLYQYTDHIDEGTVYELRLKNNPIIDPTLTNNNVRNVYLERMDDKDSVFGQFKLFTRPNKKFDVYVDDEAVGVSPYISRRLKPGDHKIRIERKKYYPVDTVLTVEKGIISNVSYKMTSYSDSMYYKCFGRKKFAMGIHAGYVHPIHQGMNSPMDYDTNHYGSRSKINLQSAFGATFGLFGDFKLHKRFYMILGVDYTYLSYKNLVSGSSENYISYTLSSNAIYKGNAQYDCEESYTHHTIEIPVLASLRFAFKNSSSLHINAGPFVSFGLSAKMEFSGTNNIEGNVYPRNGFSISETPVGTYSQTDIFSGDINLYSKSNGFKTLSNIEDVTSVEKENIYHFDEPPLKRLNYGAKIGLTYEYKGFQLGVNCKLAVSFDGELGVKIRAFSDKYDEYYHHETFVTNMLEIKLGYVFRRK